jgi:hypothetical protein
MMMMSENFHVKQDLCFEQIFFEFIVIFQHVDFLFFSRMVCYLIFLALSTALFFNHHHLCVFAPPSPGLFTTLKRSIVQKAKSAIGEATVAKEIPCPDYFNNNSSFSKWTRAIGSCLTRPFVKTSKLDCEKKIPRFFIFSSY